MSRSARGTQCTNGSQYVEPPPLPGHKPRIRPRCTQYMNGVRCKDNSCRNYHPDSVCKLVEHATGRMPPKSVCKHWHMRVHCFPWTPAPSQRTQGNFIGSRTTCPSSKHGKGNNKSTNGRDGPGSVAALREEVEREELRGSWLACRWR
jgi:hypothetical protein